MASTDSGLKQKLPDPLRRRLAKGSMAAPVVLASLASKQVLGGTPYACTLSGQLSGNVSAHGEMVCDTLGKAPADYATLAPNQWPSSTLAADWAGGTRGGAPLFHNAPASLFYTSHYRDAYEKQKVSGTGDPTASPFVAPFPSASVRDVLVGHVVKADGSQDHDWVLRARQGYVADLALGQEAVCAYLNSIDGSHSYPTYPIAPKTTVAMFNAVVVQGGTYLTPMNVPWGYLEVLAYFRSLHR